jgi:murein L,D-transpeptidase YcbB/YkuD
MDAISERIRDKVEMPGGPANFVCHEELICGSDFIAEFYTLRHYHPAWIRPQGLSPQAMELIYVINNAGEEGLNPNAYHLGSIDMLRREIGVSRQTGKRIDPEIQAELDLFLTDAFLLYGSHLFAGRINPETLHPNWQVSERSVDLAKILQNALESNQIRGALENLAPPSAGYKRLREALKVYRGLAAQGGWPTIPSGRSLRKGNHGERIPLLFRRLRVTRDLPDLETAIPKLYDENLDRAVRHFQGRHGLKVDGIVGPETLKDLNVPADQRVRQIEVNVERWRWQPRDLGPRYIIINIADFDLKVMDAGKTVMQMRVIVGQPYWSTPVFHSVMTYLIINPYWNIPYKIAVEETIPDIKRDPGYLAQKGIRVISGWQDNAPQIDPNTIDWSSMDPKSFRYRLRQDPGPLNALGRIKFMLPNKFDVYLHDTPGGELFKREQRDFSHGCVRIQEPLDLAAYLLAEDPVWTRERLSAAIASGKRQAVRLPRPIPVYFQYWTAWDDPDGSTQFRNDIYNRDDPLDRALGELPPKP